MDPAAPSPGDYTTRTGACPYLLLPPCLGGIPGGRFFYLWSYYVTTPRGIPACLPAVQAAAMGGRILAGPQHQHPAGGDLLMSATRQHILPSRPLPPSLPAEVQTDEYEQAVLFDHVMSRRT